MKAEPTAADKERLATVKAELEKINKKKADYVEEHPEQRKLVYRRKGDTAEQVAKLPTRDVYNKNGSLRHPERSLYYDPVFNPLGVPPPGMPYAERRECAGLNSCPPCVSTPSIALRPDEIDSDAEDEDDSDGLSQWSLVSGPATHAPLDDEDIPLPEGAPPEDDEGDESDSDDNIPLPEGPPPLMHGMIASGSCGFLCSLVFCSKSTAATTITSGATAA